jgi:hypothetical protein
MTAERTRALTALEGSRVHVALADSSRIDDCQLVSTGRPAAPTLWVFTNGADVFLPLADIVEVWEASA